MSTPAIILAGGKGSRLRPYTTVVPKPLLPIGERPILEIVLAQLQRDGFDRITITVGHLAHLMEAVLGDGSRHGVTIDYAYEDKPLGTAGPLAELEGLDEPFLMMNGDVLTTLSYRAVYDTHREAGNALTIAAHKRTTKVDLGVLLVEDADATTTRLTGYDEKPELQYTVSMGVYVLDPRAIEYVPRNRAFDLPDLVLALLDAGEPVGVHVFDGYWLDIGRPDDYERAAEDWSARSRDLLRGTGLDDSTVTEVAP